MMFGILKNVGAKVLREQARRRQKESLFLSQDLVDHMALERRCGARRSKDLSNRPRPAIVVV